MPFLALTLTPTLDLTLTLTLILALSLTLTLSLNLSQTSTLAQVAICSSMGGTDPANMLNALGRCGHLLRASYLRASLGVP